MKGAVHEKDIHVVSVALSRGIIDFDMLRMALDSLKNANSLPESGSTDEYFQDFITHIVIWLEIINQKYFVPVITSRHRLDAIIDTLAKSPYVNLHREGSSIIDVGTGYLPKITAMLAGRFSECRVVGTDIVFADCYVEDLHGTQIVFDNSGKIVALNSDNTIRFNRMIVDFEHTNEKFSDLFERLKGKLTGNKLYHRDRTIGSIRAKPILEFKKHYKNLSFVRNVEKSFDISSFIVERFDVIWTWNVLLHFDKDTNINALSDLKKSLKPKGIIIEGYASPSGKTVAYVVWQEDKGDLVMREFVFSSQNVQYPLWDMKDRGHIVGLLGKFVSLVKIDKINLPQKIRRPKFPSLVAPGLADTKLLDIYEDKIRKAGYAVKVNQVGHLVIEFTNEEIKLSTFEKDMEDFLNEVRLPNNPPSETIGAIVFPSILSRSGTGTKRQSSLREYGFVV